MTCSNGESPVISHPAFADSLFGYSRLVPSSACNYQHMRVAHSEFLTS
jgi:hypothetical protein